MLHYSYSYEGASGEKRGILAMKPSVLSHQADLVPIGSLKRYRGNARRGNLDVIRESLRRNGQYRPVVVRTKTREVLAGNHTWESAKLEGWTEIWATFIDCDAQTAKRINLVDNRAPELGGYDEEALMGLLGSLPDLEGTGWTDSERDKLASQLYMGTGGDTEPDPVPKEPITQPGDFYLLGEHKLLCGDSTDPADVAKLLGQEHPVCMWTDPPYGTGARDVVPGNETAGLGELLKAAYALANLHLVPGAVLYVLRPSNANGILFGQCFLEAGWRYRQTLVWLKESSAFGRHDYHYQHELIDYGFTAGPSRGRFGRKEGGWYGDDHQSSILQYDRPKAEVEHPLIKSVPLVEHCLVNSTPKNGLVYEPFCGSGTTLIACENLWRRCRAIEVDPGYCDVIVDRWERHTGRTAEKL